MEVKYATIFHSKAFSNMYTKIVIFGFKIYHLATLHPTPIPRSMLITQNLFFICQQGGRIFA
jgi:hypothetical protein